MEPYDDSYFNGIDRQSDRYLDKPPTEGLSYRSVTDKLQQPYTGKARADMGYQDTG